MWKHWLVENTASSRNADDMMAPDSHLPKRYYLRWLLLLLLLLLRQQQQPLRWNFTKTLYISLPPPWGSSTHKNNNITLPEFLPWTIPTRNVSKCWWEWCRWCTWLAPDSSRGMECGWMDGLVLSFTGAWHATCCFHVPCGHLDSSWG